MYNYKKFQFGWVIVVTFITVLVLLTLSFLYQWGTNPIDKGGYIFMMLLFISILLMFYGMTVIITDNEIMIRLGIGLITKRIKLSEIQSVATMRYPVFFGYGVRITPRGVLYNVNGRHAVEIILKNRKKAIQIGTNDWDNLRNVLESAIRTKQR